MLCREKRPPLPKVTSSKGSSGLAAGGVLMNKRTARSMSPLTEVPDAAACFFSCARRRSSSVIVVRMMHDHTSYASAHQDASVCDAEPPPSYDPVRRLFFVTARETCATWVSTRPLTITLGGPAPSDGARRAEGGREQYSALRAIDPTTGELRWEHRFRGYPSSVTLDLSGGAMSTASGVVFSGDFEGYLNAFDSATGRLLWQFQTGAPIWGAPPVTYMLDGRQWVVVPSGVTMTAFALPSGSRP